MRKIMIFVSVLLALFQMYSMVATGGRDKAPTAASVVAVAPRAVLAAASAPNAPQMAPIVGSASPPQSCYRQYQTKFQQCRAGDEACHLNAADQWDLCEATGLWPK